MQKLWNKNKCMTRYVALGALALGALLCGASWAADSNPVSGTVSGTTRYVWAKNLVVRAAPDSGSAEVGKLPLGTAVILVPATGPSISHQDIALKLAASAESPAADVTLDGNWQRVRTPQYEGWVFDGYLSRYPAPILAEDRSKREEDAELNFAKRLFGVKLAQTWKTGNSKKTADYAAMRQRSKLTSKELAGDVSWAYVEFQRGGSYEALAHQANGDMYTSSVDFKDVPMSFNEAVLWLRQFGHFAPIGSGSDGAIGKFSGKIEPGRKLEIVPADDDTSGFGFSRTIACSAETCSINYGFAD